MHRCQVGQRFYSTLSLIEGVDRYKIMDEEKPNSNDRKEERDNSRH
ncbi:MAG TPA: hypothetical protein VI278_07490 [Nitrososphaeraceae archaeon]